MDFSHYPRLENDIVVAAHYPAPPDRPNFKSLPRLSHRNLLDKPLEPGEALVACHSASNFTRFIASLACDAPLTFAAYFSNDEVAPDGHWVQDRNIASLNWDVVALEKKYTPGEKHHGIWFIKHGKWLKVEVRNVGEHPTGFLRCYVRGSTL